MMGFDERVTRNLLLMVILLLVVVSVWQLRQFLPGLLGAVTLYILSRRTFFRLIYQRHWKKVWAAFLFVTGYLIILGIPILLIIKIVSPRVIEVMENPEYFIQQIETINNQINAATGINIIQGVSLSALTDKLVKALPALLNSTVTLLSNLALMLFFLYYLLCNGIEMERVLFRFIPLKDNNTSMLAAETRKMITANALGIPIISAIQGATATLGYYIFGVEEYALLGFLTGMLAFFPIIGTLVVWVPVVIYLYASAEKSQATGLLIYSLIVTGNIDYLIRITFLKRIGDIHPVVTILGIIVGLNLFGFIGFVFGPLLISYIIILIKIYKSEFNVAPLNT